MWGLEGLGFFKAYALSPVFFHPFLQDHSAVRSWLAANLKVPVCHASFAGFPFLMIFAGPTRCGYADASSRSRVMPVPTKSCC